MKKIPALIFLSGLIGICLFLTPIEQFQPHLVQVVAEQYISIGYSSIFTNEKINYERFALYLTVWAIACVTLNFIAVDFKAKKFQFQEKYDNDSQSKINSKKPQMKMDLVFLIDFTIVSIITILSFIILGLNIVSIEMTGEILYQWKNIILLFVIFWLVTLGYSKIFKSKKTIGKRILESL